METTRHFTATVYVVNDGATALHEHKHLDVIIPPGGHVDRGELPHRAGLREVEEETGLEPTLLDSTTDVPGPVETLPQPRHHLLHDINVHDDEVGHQHIDLIFYATVPSREIDPAPGEEPAEVWDWYTPAGLVDDAIDEEVETIGIDAIETAERHTA